MRFLPNGPDIPDELIALQEKGETIFICGAGVSRMIDLPSYKGLVEKVYTELRETWEPYPAEREVMEKGGRLADQYDRVLWSLERRLAGPDRPRNRGTRARIRAAVRTALAPKADAQLGNHLALMDLSRDEEGQSRLITTNFDTLFERAWYDHHHQRVDSYANAAMPQPRASGFMGVMHLHGRIADNRPELGLPDCTDLVLTSAEFGDAYLRSGWASRYVYDVVRACTVVLVGYDANDPPMRYLLEVLEADRARYPDLHQVYAFAPCPAGDEELEDALWRAKGVQPIFYRPTSDDHSCLYESIREWRNYAADPTAWRKNELQIIFSDPAKDHTTETITRCVSLLGHGDASQILGELKPASDWLTVLLDRRVFAAGKQAHPGQWIASRLNDAAMIRASTGFRQFSADAVWYIERAIEQQRDTVSQIRRKAWQIILKSKRQETTRDTAPDWYLASRHILQGETGYQSRQIIKNLLQPHVTVETPWPDSNTEGQDNEENLNDLIRIDFKSCDDPQPTEILSHWPENLEDESALFRTLERAFAEALEEAADLGYLTGWDRSSGDVPSVATHPQNAHHHGFCPIVRVLADLWERIAGRSRDIARRLVAESLNSPYLLVRRIYLFALCSDETFSPEEAWKALNSLDDQTFWLGDARVEIMRLATRRWQKFTSQERATIEMRIRQGFPRGLFPEQAFEDDEEWQSTKDFAVMKRLARIQSAGGPLTSESETLLSELRSKYERWVPGSGDRDDFSAWYESHWGPDGQPDLLSGIADELLVSEAMRLQRERRFDQGDIWRVFCGTDPERSLRGLRLEAESNRWDVSAWRDLLWAASSNGDDALQFELAGLLLGMPDQQLSELLPSACSWLEKRRRILTNPIAGRTNFLNVWDRFATLAYAARDPASEDVEGKLVEQALYEPSGVLAWILLEAVAEEQPVAGSGLTIEQSNHFARAVGTTGKSGLLARATLCRALAYLESIDHEWAHTHLVPCLMWDQPNAAEMWHARSYDRLGSAQLFNALRRPMLQSFERPEMSDNDLERFMAQLLMIGLAHLRRELDDFLLSSMEIKRALSASSSSVRANAAWQLWRLMDDAGDTPFDKPTRWRKHIGPLFQDIWPLDASLRSENTSRNLVMMALNCADAFPEAVDAIVDVLIPYQLYLIAHVLRLDPAHEAVVKDHPRAALRLANAIIDPVKYPVPSDLAEFLQICRDADPPIVSEPSYIRLFGLRRQRDA